MTLKHAQVLCSPAHPLPASDRLEHLARFSVNFELQCLSANEHVTKSLRWVWSRKYLSRAPLGRVTKTISLPLSKRHGVWPHRHAEVRQPGQEHCARRRSDVHARPKGGITCDRELLTQLLISPQDSKFRESGMITPEEFVEAGDYLVYHCPTWSWSVAHTHTENLAFCETNTHT